jgi:hypothetical protein
MKSILSFSEAYKLLTGQVDLPSNTIRSRLTYLRNRHGLKGLRIGSNYFYDREDIFKFIRRLKMS